MNSLLRRYVRYSYTGLFKNIGVRAVAGELCHQSGEGGGGAERDCGQIVVFPRRQDSCKLIRTAYGMGPFV